jgi:excinuclease ABC subunit C
MQKEQNDKKQHYIEHILQNLPHKPGVYKMVNQKGEVLYVGKAKDLKHRVSSYFQKRDDKGMRTLKMVEQINDIEYIEVNSELEALILETNFIKELRPKYNVLMKDDKNYVYIKITVDEPYPRIYIVRKVSKGKARYFGPKTAAHKVIKTLKVLKKIFPFRHCQLSIDYLMPGKEKEDHKVKVTKANIKFPCLDYHIKRCIGPCIGKVSPEEYRKIIDQVIRFLEGKHEEIIEKLREEMIIAAEQKKFEQAAAIRDKLQAVEEITERQRISDPHQKDLDIINYFPVENKIYFNLFQLRNGKLIGQENFVFDTEENQTEGQESQVLSAFLEQYYEKATDLPQEILIPSDIEEHEAMEVWLQQMKGQKVHLLVPERGKKNHLLDLSLENAKSFAKQSQIKWEGEEKGNRNQALQKLQEILRLPKPPGRLECYDISHFGGTETVGSMVVFENGFPKKSDYRHFKLHQETSGAPNDFASMEEALTRRLKYLKPSFLGSDLKISKAKKNDLKRISTELRLKKLPQASFWVVEKEKRWAGFVQSIELPSKKHLIEKIQLTENLDLKMLLKKIREKTKQKRLYLSISAHEIAKYEEAGCQIVRKVPEGIKLKPGRTILVFDQTKFQEDSSFKKTPDLLIIDGGKGQLSSALKALKKFGLSLPMISLAKREEEIFIPGQSQPIILEKNYPVLHLIQHIRDEAHRFAVTYHQNLRLKATTHSVLDTIAGIGPEYKVKLLRTFGSTENIQNASTEELAAVVGKKNAERIKERITP